MQRVLAAWRPRPDGGAMPLVQEVRHPKSLDFCNEKKVVIARDVRGCTWEEVAASVVNLQGEQPSVSTVKRIYANLSTRTGRRTLGYKRCGRKPWKCTKAVEAYLISRLRSLRRATVCTAETLRVELVKGRGVHLDSSTIRKILRKHGYRWLPRAQKPQVDADLAKARVKFAKGVVRMTKKELRGALSLSMDGVIFSCPPRDPAERANFCKQGITHMYRKIGEAAQPDLSGDDPYPDQIPPSRLVPMWGGISEGGCAIVTFHGRRKITTDEWVKAVKAKKLKAAILSTNPLRRRGSWRVLCDGEKFLWSRASKKACSDCHVTLWPMPPKSPDLNPVEKFWGWLRKRLLLKDLADLEAGRPALTKKAYKARIRCIMRTRVAQAKARRFAGDFRRVCKEVIKKKGARVK